MIALSGYSLNEKIYEDSTTLVYRAICESDSQPVIIKLLRREYPNASELVQFRNQYTIAKNLDLPGIVRPYSLEPYHNGYALVVPDEGLISLHEWRQGKPGIEGYPKWIADFLAIAIQLADILHGLYQNRVIHKNINPANILIHPKTKQVKLSDFSIASLLPKESQEIKNPNPIEGTLAYLAPEQTGRMNRGIDYRTDFYSFGVTFYELLAGELPFQSDDPMELVHCHLAKQPPPLGNRKEIPAILSEIAMKLMAKNAEERYQSALGLKYDLEKCLEQWQETGTIEPFSLGERDISERFLIPEKLYGREAEVATLLAAFERVYRGDGGESSRDKALGASVENPTSNVNRPNALSVPPIQNQKSQAELILVSGFSGIGKTAVVNEIHKPIIRQRGYFIKGKFEQYNRNIPFSAFVQAFRDLMEQLLSESDAQLLHWQNQILAALGENAQTIVEVIPELERIIGQQPPVPKLSGSAVQNRFNLIFQKFIRVFSSQDHPLAIFLDDLQWADSASLQLIQCLLSEPNASYLLAIGAYRDNEVFPAHPLLLALDALEQEGVPINTITLSSLSESSLNQLIAETFSCTAEMALPLTQLVYQKTKGNPFFSIQFLKALHDDGLIAFNAEKGYWQCEIDRIKAKAVTDDVVEFMALRLQKLPAATQNLLKLAACIGNQFDLETLAVVSQQSLPEIAKSLWRALQEGFILPVGEVYQFLREEPEAQSQDSTLRQHHSSDLDLLASHSCSYRFLHDRVQQAVYSLIPETQKQATLLQVSQLLLGSLSEAELEEKIFDLVNRLNYGVELMTQHEERERLMQLNLRAGCKAKATTAYAAAMEYFSVGLRLLFPNSWETDYSLTLMLYEEAIETAYLCGNFQQMENWATVLLESAIDILDKVKTYEVKIAAYVAQNQLRKAIEVALSVLKPLGVEFPQQPTPADWERGVREVTSNLAGKPVASALDLPLMSDPYSQAALRILLSIDAATYLAFPELLPLTICKQVNLSLLFGNMPGSAKAYANYGLILCSGLGDLEIGYQFGQLALNLLERLEANEISARTSFLVNFLIRPWKESLRQTLKPLQEAYAIALETGDLAHAAFAMEKYCYHAYFAGKALPQLAGEMEIYAEKMVQLKQDAVLCTHYIHWQSVLNLLGDNANPCRLIGRVCDETKVLPLYRENNSRTALYYLYFNKLFLCYLFNDYFHAIANGEWAEQYLDGGSGQFIFALFYFYDSLTHLATYSHCSPQQQNKILVRVAANQEKMHHWARCAPMNFQHKYDLVAAERHRVVGEKAAAIECYDAAITGAKNNEYLPEEAIANELAARFWLDWKKEKIAQSYLIEAYYCYSRWGAKAKVDDLEQRYPQLLDSILNPDSPSFQPHPKLLRDAKPSRTRSRVKPRNGLDLASVLKVSQAISEEIQLENLLATLIRVTLESAGAEKCALILAQNEHWDAIAVGNGDTVNVNTAPARRQADAFAIADRADLPLSAIDYVKRTLKTLAIDDATDFNQIRQCPALQHDPYILRQQPKSLLCAPIIGRGKPIGILYLENNQCSKAFTPERLEILNPIATQAAISIENALLYSQLEDYSRTLELKIDERTAQLESAKQTAEAANKAKSEFLANMSHELRTPLNAILGFTQVLLRTDTSPQERRKYLEIVNRSGEHLLSLINDILAMSKIEAGRMTLNANSFDLYNLLDTIEEMFRFKAEAKGLQLSCERSPALPQYIKTDESKLRQVLINLLGNAIKFTPQGSITLRVSSVNSDRLSVNSNQSGVRSQESGVGTFHETSVREFRSSGDRNQEFGSSGVQESEERNTPHLPISPSPPVSPSPHPLSLQFEVEDTGVGIDPDEIDALFSPFTQTTSGIKSQEGTGLGLPISYKFVQLMGGQLRVRSTPKQGSLFCFSIEATDAIASEVESVASVRPVAGLAPDQTIPRILVVEDNDNNRQLLVKLLSSVGLEVREAIDGQEAIEIWQEWKPHLIWMDMRMPVMNGYEAASAIASQRRERETVVVALTASALEEERSAILAAGCDDFVLKPFRAEEIFAMLQKHLGLRYLYSTPEEDTAVRGQSSPCFSDRAPAESLAQMPAEWVAQLEQEANRGDDDAIVALLEQIPETHCALAEVLLDWIGKFNFDAILNLVEQSRG